MNWFKVMIRNSPLIVLSVGLAIALFHVWSFYKDKVNAEERVSKYEDLIGSVEEYEQLTKHLAQLKTDYASQKSLLKKLEKEWKQENEKLKDKIKALADVSLEGSSDEEVIETDKLYREVSFCCDEEVNGGRGPAVGKVEFELQSDNTYRATSKLLDHEIRIKAAVTKDHQTGKVSILTKGYWIQLEGAENDFWKGMPYPLTITGGSVTIDPTQPIESRKPSFMFAPHINLGLYGGVANEDLNYGARLGVSLWGYGKTENDLDFKLGQLGINVSRGYLDFNVSPVSYRIGNHFPLVEDVYITPGVGMGSVGWNYFLSLETTL